MTLGLLNKSAIFSDIANWFMRNKLMYGRLICSVVPKASHNLVYPLWMDYSDQKSIQKIYNISMTTHRIYQCGTLYERQYFSLSGCVFEMKNEK